MPHGGLIEEAPSVGHAESKSIWYFTVKTVDFFKKYVFYMFLQHKKRHFSYVAVFSLIVSY